LKISFYEKLICYFLNISLKIRGKICHPKPKWLQKKIAKQIEDRIIEKTDLIFVPGGWGIPIAFLQTKIPIVLYQDAQFLSLNNDYEYGKRKLTKKVIKEITELEMRAMNMASLIIYSSNWAAESAIKLYKLPKEKIGIIPFGANIECDRKIENINLIIKQKKFSKCKLLFVGVDWYRKNCQLCIEIAKNLNYKGLPTQLDIVGIKEIPINNLPKFIINRGFISKTNYNEKILLEQLYSEAHFLIVPSRQEAFGLVFCEANSFGVPAISTNIGGINDVIENNKNGIKFDLNADVEDYSKWIIETFNNRLKYEDLSKKSFFEYEKRLNWEISGLKLKLLLNKYEIGSE
jgi:glycosyltransferase involved in cell wall biosynthesis